MLDSTEAFKKAINANARTIYAFFVINNQAYDNTKIVKMEYDSAVAGGSNFVPGGTFINGLTVEIKEIIEDLQEMMTASAFLGIDVIGEQTFYPLGRFFLTKIKLDRNAGMTHLTLQDEFVRLLDFYDSQLTYPTTSRRVLQEIVSMTNITTEVNLQLGDHTIDKKLEKATYRDALMYLAQLDGTFARFNRYCHLDFIDLKTTQKHISKDMYGSTSLKREEIKYAVGAIVCEVDKKEMRSGNQSGNQMTFKNPWMTQGALDSVYHKYRHLSFYPYELSWRGDMSLEAGDWVSVHWGDSVRFDIPMMSYKLIFDGGLTAVSGAKEVGQVTSRYVYKGPLQDKIDYLTSLTSSIGSIYTNEQEPKNPKNKDVWFKPTGGYVKLLEYINGEWIEKADTANIDSIVDSMTKDEVVAKKLYAAIANFIEINANKIIAGDIDLKRLRIMDGQTEVLAVRDGKVVVNVGGVWKEAGKPGEKGPKGDKGDQGQKGDTGATGQSLYTWVVFSDDEDGNGLSTEPTNKKCIGWSFNKETQTPVLDKTFYVFTPLTDRSLFNAMQILQLQQQEQSSKISGLEVLLEQRPTKDQLAALSTVFSDFKSDYQKVLNDSQILQYPEFKRTILTQLGDTQAAFETTKKFLNFDNTGLTLGDKTGSLQVKVTNDKIAFLDSGKEVMYVTNQLLYITSGIFVTSLQVGNHIIERLRNSNIHTTVRYTGGVI